MCLVIVPTIDGYKVNLNGKLYGNYTTREDAVMVCKALKK